MEGFYKAKRPTTPSAPARPAPMIAVGIDAPADEEELPEELPDEPLDPELPPAVEVAAEPPVEVPSEARETTELFCDIMLARMEDCPALTALLLPVIPVAIGAIAVAFALVMLAAAELSAAGFVARGTR